MPPRAPKGEKAARSEQIDKTPSTDPTPRSRRPKTAKPILDMHKLDADASNGNVPVDVHVDGTSKISKANDDTGLFRMSLTLEGIGSFALINTSILKEGQYEGHQAIIIRPARPFPFQKLPPEIRNRIYQAYFANTSKKTEAITLDGRRPRSRDLYAKGFAAGSKHRVALLAVNGEIYDEAISILYSQRFQFDNTAPLLDFLGFITPSSRRLLADIWIDNAPKSNARHAWNFLAEAQSLRRLHIAQGVSTDRDPLKAAQTFLNDASKFIEAMGRFKGSRVAGVDVLSFGRTALMYSVSEKSSQLKPWTADMVEEFRSCLKSKLV